MAHGYKVFAIDLNVLDGVSAEYDVGDNNVLTIDHPVSTGSWSNAVLTVQGAMDDDLENWTDLSTTLVGIDETYYIDVDAYRYVRLKVTTVEGGPGIAGITMFSDYQDPNNDSVRFAEIDLTDFGTRFATILDVDLYNRMYIDARRQAGSGAWTVGVLTLKWSVNGHDWNVFSPSVTFATSSVSSEIDLTAIRFVSLEVTTAQAGIKVSLALYSVKV